MYRTAAVAAVVVVVSRVVFSVVCGINVPDSGSRSSRGGSAPGSVSIV